MADISDIASRQHGVISAAQLAACGLSVDQRKRLVAAQRLHRLHRGVYAVGHLALTRRSHWMAAILATGNGTLLARRSAAQLHDLLGPAGHRDDIEVLRPGHPRRIPQVKVIRGRPAKRWLVDGIPATSISRTIVDLAEVLPQDELERVAERAEFKRALKARQILREIEHRAKAPSGISKLRAVLGDERLDAVGAGSQLEREALRAMLAAQLPRPELQRRFVIGAPAKQILDMYWPEARLVVEIDGPHHERPLARLRDRERDAGLSTLGVLVHRVPYTEVEEHPARMVAVIRQLLTERCVQTGA